MKILKEQYNREEIMDYLTDLHKAGYGYEKKVEDIMDTFDLDEETADSLVSDWAANSDPDETVEHVLVKEDAADNSGDLQNARKIAEDYILNNLFEVSGPEEMNDIEAFRNEIVNPVVDDFFKELPDGKIPGPFRPFTEEALIRYVDNHPKVDHMMNEFLYTVNENGHHATQFIVKEDAGDNTKSHTESLKLTADYFLGQLRGLVDKVSKEDSEGAKLFFKNANNTLKDLVRQFEDLKANF